jgi:hypothetical protein
MPKLYLENLPATERERKLSRYARDKTHTLSKATSGTMPFAPGHRRSESGDGPREGLPKMGDLALGHKRYGIGR